MGFNWRWIENILLLVIIVFAIFFGDVWSRWVIVIAALILLIERFIDRGVVDTKTMPVMKQKSIRKKAKKKKK